MKVIVKLNNALLFFLAAFVPFGTTFDNTIFKYLDFNHLYYELFFFSAFIAIVTKRNLSYAKIGSITKYLILFFIVEIISGIFSFDTDLALQKLFLDFKFLLVLLFINGLIINESSYRNIFAGLLVGFLAACAIAILQSRHYQQFYLFSLQKLNVNTGLEHGENDRLALVRIWGPFGNSLSFSEYLSVVGIILYTYYRVFKRKIFIAIPVLILAVYCTVLTVARTALISIGFALLILEFIYAKALSSSKVTIYSIIFLTIALVAIIFLLPGIQDNGNPLISRFFNVTYDFKEGRMNLWIKGFQAFSKNILLGVGPGNLHGALSSEGYPLTSAVIAAFDGQHVENYFLTLLYTYGILGFYFQVGVYYYLTTYSYKLFLLLRGTVIQSAFGGAMFGGVIALIINNITNPGLIFDQRLQMMYIFMIIIINNSFLTYDKVNFYKQSTLLRNLFTKR